LSGQRRKEKKRENGPDRTRFHWGKSGNGSLVRVEMGEKTTSAQKSKKNGGWVFRV